MARSQERAPLSRKCRDCFLQALPGSKDSRVSPVIYYDKSNTATSENCMVRRFGASFRAVNRYQWITWAPLGAQSSKHDAYSPRLWYCLYFVPPVTLRWDTEESDIRVGMPDLRRQVRKSLVGAESKVRSPYPARGD